ncbi:MAG TPA: TFIIB-type zinc ribbon-containing protein [Patescibacteria group bacterium]|nr:TFIIB-type zinc ribbon-containing protein [Patescibacteria group bacterium]
MDILDETMISVCLECGGRNLINDRGSGEVVCGGCGLVLAEATVSTEPEWSAFTPNEHDTRSRVGLPLSISIHDKGLSTMIGQIYKDGKGRMIPKEERYRMLRLRRWQTRSNVNSSEERNLTKAMSELDRLTERLHSPRAVKEQAAVIYRRALKEGFIRGRSISSMVAASLYAALRVTWTPMTLSDVARVSPIDKKDIARCYRVLLRELKIRVPVPKAQLRVSKIASKVELGEKTQRMAVEILGEADRLKISIGKDPMGLAASALYLACIMNGEKRTQKRIADAAGVTEVTIRNRYKELESSFDPDRFKPSHED